MTCPHCPFAVTMGSQEAYDAIDVHVRVMHEGIV